MGIKLGRMILSSIGTNCYFAYNEDKAALVFDPGDDGEGIYDRLTEKGFRIAGIVLTHGHFDHIMGVDALKKKADCQVYAPAAEEKLLSDPELNCTSDMDRQCTVKPDVLLEDGEIVNVEGISFRTILTPGHTAGSACFYFEDDRLLISGDTLFEGSVGRTDLPTGNMGELVRSIKTKLMVLPDDVEVYPGHGGQTTIGEEKKYNPFF